jgi:hypothetical protein
MSGWAADGMGELLPSGSTIADLDGHERTADDTDRFFLAWDEWRREAGPDSTASSPLVEPCLPAATMNNAKG